MIDDNAGIVHVLDTPGSFSAGNSVKGEVEWPRRFDHMQQHTGQHLLSALFEDNGGGKTVSVHFGEESATIELDVESISRDRAVRVETRANAVVAENRAVSVTFEDAATAAGLRKPSDRAGEIRIVSIDGVDRSACGGTHVRATGEIGAVLIRRIEKYKSTRAWSFSAVPALLHARARTTRRSPEWQPCSRRESTNSRPWWPRRQHQHGPSSRSGANSQSRSPATARGNSTTRQRRVPTAYDACCTNRPLPMSPRARPRSRGAQQGGLHRHLRVTRDDHHLGVGRQRARRRRATQAGARNERRARWRQREAGTGYRTDDDGTQGHRRGSQRLVSGECARDSGNTVVVSRGRTSRISPPPLGRPARTERAIAR